MYILAIETTGPYGSTALLDEEGTVLGFEVSRGTMSHLKDLIPMIDTMLKKCGVAKDQIDLIAPSVGPGSFTGIRIGVSAMTAIAFATGAKRIAVTSFDLIAHQRGEILAAVDAGHGNLYLAKCRNGKVLETSFCEASDAAKISGAVFTTLNDVGQTLAEVVKEKAQNGEYVNVFEPFYMRKSQAEREKDEV